MDSSSRVACVKQFPLLTIYADMPTYDFRCPNGHDFEKFYRNMSESLLQLSCPLCGAVAERQMSGGAGLVFKGSGFYLTDYGKNAHRKAEPSAAGAGKKEGGGDSGGDSNSGSASESKSEAKSETKGGDAKPSESRSSDSKQTDSKKADSKSSESKQSPSSTKNSGNE